MQPTSFKPEVTIWTDTRHVHLVEELFHLMAEELNPIGLGGPREPEIDQLARSLDCHYENDMRKLIVEKPAAFLFLTEMQDVELDEILAATENSTIVLSLEPDIDSFDGIRYYAMSSAANAAVGKSECRADPRLITQIPQFLQSPGIIHAADPHECLGRPRLVNLDSCGNPDAGSLYARLYDAWHCILHFMELPESIDASLLGPLTEVPENMRQLTGSIAAHARSADGSGVALSLSDQAGETRRHLHIVGDQGELNASDTGYTLHHAGGEEVDRYQSKGHQNDFVELIAAQWRRIIDRPNLWINSNTRHRDNEVLACCQACLLSFRTGQGENPQRILAMNR